MNLQDWLELAGGIALGLIIAHLLIWERKSRHQLARLNQMAASVNRILALRTLVFSAINDFERKAVWDGAKGVSLEVKPLVDELRSNLLTIFGEDLEGAENVSERLRRAKEADEGRSRT